MEDKSCATAQAPDTASQTMSHGTPIIQCMFEDNALKLYWNNANGETAIVRSDGFGMIKEVAEVTDRLVRQLIVNMRSALVSIESASLVYQNDATQALKVARKAQERREELQTQFNELSTAHLALKEEFVALQKEWHLLDEQVQKLTSVPKPKRIRKR